MNFARIQTRERTIRGDSSPPRRTTIERLRKYGKPPFHLAVIHGGPGLAGEMAPVARELSSFFGTLEPLQTAASIEGQIQELKSGLAEHGDLPLTLIGHSWGAWLSYMFAARYPTLVKKLILVGSGPFEEEYATRVTETRLSRLSEDARAEVRALMEALNTAGDDEHTETLSRLGALMAGADSFDPLPDQGREEELEYRSDVFRSVWQEASALRRSGVLLAMARDIRCPVVAIHGDYDPHPFEGVDKPLSCVLKDFRCILLRNCGHEPWRERGAREPFFDILRNELG